MAKNRWFGTWVLATLSLLGIRQGRPSHSAETRLSNMLGRHSRTQAAQRRGALPCPIRRNCRANVRMLNECFDRRY